MAGGSTDWFTSSRAVGLGWLGLVFAVVMPLLASTTDAPATTGLLCVAVAVLAFTSLGCSNPARSTRPLLSRAAGTVRIDPRSGGQVTDPTHHPLRPRAPGLV
jgi:hypothetical protein